MNNKTTALVLATVLFALVGTLVFSSIGLSLSEADAKVKKDNSCNENSPDGKDGDLDGDFSNNDGGRGCGPNK